MELNRKLSVVFSFPVILGANVLALTRTQVNRFHKTFRIIERSNEAEDENRSDKIIQNIQNRTQYYCADRLDQETKINQLMKNNLGLLSQIKSSMSVLI